MIFTKLFLFISILSAFYTSAFAQQIEQENLKEFEQVGLSELYKTQLRNSSFTIDELLSLLKQNNQSMISKVAIRQGYPEKKESGLTGQRAELGYGPRYVDWKHLDVARQRNSNALLVFIVLNNNSVLTITTQADNDRIDALSQNASPVSLKISSITVNNVSTGIDRLTSDQSPDGFNLAALEIQSQADQERAFEMLRNQALRIKSHTFFYVPMPRKLVAFVESVKTRAEEEAVTSPSSSTPTAEQEEMLKKERRLR